jgi:hypothetical protein
MHLYIMTRGTYDCTMRYINDLMAQYLPYENKPGEKALLALGVRPVWLFEIAFPKPCLKEVLKMVQPYDTPNLAPFTRLLAKGMGLTPMPQSRENPSFRVFKRNVSVTGIGLKDDKFSQIHVEQI